MSVTVQAVCRRGEFTLDAHVTVEAGTTTAVMGPNGCGKSTLIRLLAGLEPAAHGRVEVGAITVDDPANGTWVGPERRPVGLVPQRPTLFPHLDVRDNVAFGCRPRAGRAAARRVAEAWLGRVGMGGRGGERPDTLSGGEAQRVALARALAPEPAVLLLDEPAAALDPEARQELTRLVRAAVADGGRTCVLTTHDPVEAMVLADRIVVLEHGRVAQAGAPRELRASPGSPFIARLTGANVVRGRADGRKVTTTDGLELHTAEPHAGAAGAEVFVTFPPNAVLLHRAAPEGSARNVWRTVVEGVHVGDDRARIELGAPLPAVAEVTPDAVRALELSPGAEMWASLKATELEARAV